MATLRWHTRPNVYIYIKGAYVRIYFKLNPDYIYIYFEISKEKFEYYES